jgi:hypothetical protein
VFSRKARGNRREEIFGEVCGGVDKKNPTRMKKNIQVS